MNDCSNMQFMELGEQFKTIVMSLILLIMVQLITLGQLTKFTWTTYSVSLSVSSAG